MIGAQLLETRQGAHMDVAFYVAVLRDQTKYLRTLSAQLIDKFEQIEQALSEQKSLDATQTGNPLDGLAELNNRLSATAELLHQRLRLFLADPPLPLRKPDTP